MNYPPLVISLFRHLYWEWTLHERGSDKELRHGAADSQMEAHNQASEARVQFLAEEQTMQNCIDYMYGALQSWSGDAAKLLVERAGKAGYRVV